MHTAYLFKEIILGFGENFLLTGVTGLAHILNKIGRENIGGIYLTDGIPIILSAVHIYTFTILQPAIVDFSFSVVI